MILMITYFFNPYLFIVMCFSSCTQKYHVKSSTDSPNSKQKPVSLSNTGIQIFENNEEQLFTVPTSDPITKNQTTDDSLNIQSSLFTSINTKLKRLSLQTTKNDNQTVPNNNENLLSKNSSQKWSQVSVKEKLQMQYQIIRQNSIDSNDTNMTNITEFSDSDDVKHNQDDLGIIDNTERILDDLAPPKRKKVRVMSKPVLVLDMDETMIHSTFEYSSLVEKTFQIPITPETAHLQIDPNSKTITIFICIREGLWEFLYEMSKIYSLYVWTLGSQAYADQILDYLEIRMLKTYKTKRIFKKRFYQHHCDDTIKNLLKLKLDMRKVIIVDDSQESFQLQQENAIQIPKFLGQKDDCLIQLKKFLKEQSLKNDVRNDLKIYWE